MKPTLVLLVVGLTPSLVGEHTPNLLRLARSGGMRPLKTVLPAVTCTVQTTLLTGLTPAEHGAVANGWYFRDLAEVALWRQSNHLVAGEKIWEAGRKRDGGFTCAKMFWWYNMYSSADWSATPRPMYPADGRKIRTIMPIRRSCMASSTKSSGPSRCSASGARRPISPRANGSPRRPCM
jgi:predicted AlkP superfamily pyrophosphatase or phosphodiesterase